MATTIGGEIDVYPWAPFQMRVGDVVLDAVISLDQTRTNYTTVGTSTIVVADNYGEVYDSVEFLDEIEVFIQDPEDLYVPNKVWGGYLQNRMYLQGNTHKLQITGTEYSNSLFNTLYSHDYSAGADIGQIGQDIINNNGLFTTQEIANPIGKLANLKFTNSRSWDAMAQTFNPLGFEFGVTLDSDVYARSVADSPNSPDEIALGSNIQVNNSGQNPMIVSTQQSIGSNVATTVTTQGPTTATTATVSDSEAEQQYGTSMQILSILPQSASTTTSTAYANQLLANQSSPAIMYQVQSTALLHTNPNDNLEVTIEGTSLSSFYKVIAIEDVIATNGNLSSTVSLNYIGLSSNDILLNIAKRYNQAEQAVYS
jgi:hypothetical protein